LPHDADAAWHGEDADAGGPGAAPAGTGVVPAGAARMANPGGMGTVPRSHVPMSETSPALTMEGTDDARQLARGRVPAGLSPLDRRTARRRHPPRAGAASGPPVGGRLRGGRLLRPERLPDHRDPGGGVAAGRHDPVRPV